MLSKYQPGVKWQNGPFWTIIGCSIDRLHPVLDRLRQEPMTPDSTRPHEPPVPTAGDAARLVTHLAQARPGHRRVVEARELTAEIALLRRFQSQRLAQTHADLLASPRFGPAAQFFLTDVYGPRDFSQRDADLQRFYDGVRRVLPERAVAVLADVVNLSALTNELDDRLIHALVDDLHVTDTITLEQYAAAYRLCDNHDERLRQLQLIEEIGRGIDRMVRIPFIAIALRLAHAPAVLAGWAELQEYLERGFSAFKHMKGADEFMNAIIGRETRILEAIFAHEPKPFGVTSDE